MRILLVLIVLISSFGLKGQRLDSVNTDSLKFKLEIIAIDKETNDTLKNATVGIYGTDGSSRKYKSDSLGIFPMIDLEPNTSYSLVVNKNKYLIAKGKETTVGLIASRNFNHEYVLQKLLVCGPFFLSISYEHNSLEPFSNEENSDLTSFYYGILTDNPSIVFQIQGFRDKSEKKKISKQRAENYKALLVKMGINKKRLVTIDGGILDKEDSKENRTINFKVVSTDFEAK